jgi:hypothetical protein
MVPLTTSKGEKGSLLSGKWHHIHNGETSVVFSGSIFVNSS